LASLKDKKKSSEKLLWLIVGVVLVLFLFLLRADLLKLGEAVLRSSGLWQRESDSAKSASGAESAADGLSRRGDASPFRGGTLDDVAIPVAFKGVVLNETGRVPIGGARIRMLALSSQLETIEKTTGADGVFKIDAPAAYRYELNVEAEGFKSYKNDTLVITRPNYSMEILLNRSLMIKGVVMDPQSQGIPNAMVGLFGEGGDGPFISAPTDAQGAFSFAFALPRGGRFKLEAFHAGYDSMGAAVAKTPVEEEIVLRMKPASATGSLIGLVQDAALTPIAGAKISISDAASQRTVSEILTDQKGEYRLSRIREGNIPVRCAAEGFAQTDNYQSAVTISAGKESRLDFNLKAGQQIRGIVVNQKGEPVANATVIYRPVNIPRGGNRRDDGTAGPRSSNRGGDGATGARSGNAEDSGNSASSGRNRGDMGAFGSRGGNRGNLGAFGSRDGNRGDMGSMGPGGGNMGDMGSMGPGGGNRRNRGSMGPGGGNMGDMGSMGPGGGNRGNMGSMGPSGGNRGSMGSMGSRGGNMGDMGSMGPRGGNMGDMGSMGSRGGNMGDMASIGPRGGNMGDTSSSGTRGRNMGDRGALGAMQNFIPTTGSTTTDAKGRFQIIGLAEDPYQVNIQHRDYVELSTQLQPSSQQQTLILDGALSLRGTVSSVQGVPIEGFSLMFQSTSITKRFAKSFPFTTSDGHFEVRGLTPDKYTIILRISDGESYNSTLDLQSSMQVLLLAGETTESGSEARSELRGGRGGGRGNMQDGGRGGRGRGGNAANLTIISGR
jgi:hypothetical protein